MQDRRSPFERSAFQAMEIVSVSDCGRALEGGEEGLLRKGRWNVFQFVAVGVESEQVRKAAELVFFHEGFTFFGFVLDSGENIVVLDAF